ncbi:hypothetical protein [Actinomadura atramentaria]|uniref:hypothetical protein n=1 Tax=Actinomadura atramentaria TaxID=1990 RepID=UPI000375F971|nr:hypothetical protein [Actinomadura atramentaria]
MPWDVNQRRRLAHEVAALRAYFPDFRFHDPTGDTYVAGHWYSNTESYYQFHVQVPPGYPNECPHTYITYPTPLRDYRGRRTLDSYGTSHAMHLWRTDRPGWTKICTYRPEFWSADHSLVKVIRKALLWTVAYECHLQDGRPLQSFLLDFN